MKDYLNIFANNIKTAFSNKNLVRSLIAIIIFILLNTLKTVIYNLFLLPQANSDIFTYKFWFVLITSTIVLLFVIGICSRVCFAIILIIQGIYMFTNISYYLYYHSYLHIMQWFSLFKEAAISASHLANPQSAQLLIVFLDVPVIIYLLIKFYSPELKTIRKSKIRYAVIALCLICLTVTEGINISSNKSINDFIGDRYSGESKIVERYGTTVNAAINIFNNYSEEKLISQFEYGNLQEGNKDSLSALPNNQTQQAPNFVIVQVESMDSNIVKQKYNDQYVMPFLAGLMDTSVYYPYTLSYHQGGGTSDTEFSIINSIQPLDSFPAIKLSSYSHSNSFVSRLKNASYETMALHGNVGTFYNRDISFYKMGFNKFYDIKSMGSEDEGWGAPDHKVFDFAFRKMQQTKKPFCSYIITMTSHGPFESCRNYYNNPRYDSIEDEIVKNYFNSMSYVDESLKNFVNNIRAKFPNTYIFIVGDHTPNINEPEFYQSSFIDGDKYLEFVPLFIVTPDNQKYVETTRVASFLDISPTILECSGIPYSLMSNGHSLLTLQKNTINIDLKGGSFDRSWLYEKISNIEYSEEEPIWRKYLPDFIKSDLFEKHN